MLKCKKFNVAEKHFERKCVKWQKKINELEQVNKTLHKKICENCDEIEKLQMENEGLKQQNETLIKLKDMSVEDVKILIKSREAINNISDLFKIMTHDRF